MSAGVYVPSSRKAARGQLRTALAGPLESLSKSGFVRAWCSLAYLYPGLHPDGYADADSGWPRILKRFAAEAWRRAAAGELADEELYACDAQWSGLYDRMRTHKPDETKRRRELAVSFGECVDA